MKISILTLMKIFINKRFLVQEMKFKVKIKLCLIHFSHNKSYKITETLIYLIQNIQTKLIPTRKTINLLTL